MKRPQIKFKIRYTGDLRSLSDANFFEASMSALKARLAGRGRILKFHNPNLKNR